MRSYITVSIPYVNARPHVGYAVELVEADVLARQRRRRNGEARCASSAAPTTTR